MRTLLLLTLLVASVAQAQRTQPPVPFIIGVTESFHSTVLGEDRLVHIHLPPGYAADTAVHYPVIYLLDGSADEDFLHVVGGLQFASFPWVKWMPPSIVVGIANVDRMHNFTHPTSIAAAMEQFPTSGGSAAFQQFLSSELVPFVEANYRVSGDRTLIGQSLGGLLATEVLLRMPYLFSHYLIISPSLWWDNGSVLDIPTDALMAPDIGVGTVYIAVGKEGKVMVGPAKQLAGLLRKRSHARVGYQHITDLDHANILHQAMMDYFLWRAEP